MQRNKKRTALNTNNPNKIITALTAGGIGLGCTLILSLGAPLILLKTADPKSFITLTAALCISFGGLASGIFCGLKQKDSPLITSVISGAFMFLPLAVFSLFIKGGFDIIGACVNAACLFSFPCLSAFLLNRSSKNNGKNMKKLMKRR